jgi:hypothetical protein
MNEFLKAWRSVDRNTVALILSVIPGAGHLYKHHYASGLGILIGGNILMGFAAVLLTLGTFGLSLILVPAVYWIMIGAAAYSIPDWHGHHHYLHPWTHEDQE